MKYVYLCFNSWDSMMTRLHMYTLVLYCFQRFCIEQFNLWYVLSWYQLMVNVSGGVSKSSLKTSFVFSFWSRIQIWVYARFRAYFQWHISVFVSIHEIPWLRIIIFYIHTLTRFCNYVQYFSVAFVLKILSLKPANLNPHRKKQDEAHEPECSHVC